MNTISHQHDHGKPHGHRRAAKRMRRTRPANLDDRPHHLTEHDAATRHPRLHVLPLGQNRPVHQSGSARVDDANTRLVRHLRLLARALGVDLNRLEVSIGPTETTLRYGPETGPDVHHPETGEASQ